LQHIDHLARVIGPRGSTSAGERQAADYVCETFRRSGLEPRVESFRAPVSALQPHVLALTLVLVAVAIQPLAGRASAIAALALFAAAIVSDLREVHLRWSPLRVFLPKGSSQNVWAVARAASEARKRVALVAHFDSQRAALLFSPRLRLVLRVLMPVASAAIVSLAVLLILGVLVSARTIFLVSWVPVAIIIPILLLNLQADFAPYTPGANDNATGAALLLALAETLQADSLPNTEVWLVATGCEEVGCYGASAFFRAHRAELQEATILVVDTVGGTGTGPCYLTVEGMLLRYRYDAELLSLADTIAHERPELGAYGRPLPMGYTDGLPALQAGLRTLTLCGLSREGDMPHWHQPTDTVENIDRQVLGQNYAFIQELLHRIDGSSFP
jgi:hypothetical protein